ncbi:hypothetical protein TNCV_5101251 [Trichonephila clavipes]|nr:hypothetical protein TNCV_5101251 [Trichonephila clavipes]
MDQTEYNQKMTIEHYNRVIVRSALIALVNSMNIDRRFSERDKATVWRLWRTLYAFSDNGCIQSGISRTRELFPVTIPAAD